MKKIIILSVVIISVAILSGCGTKQEAAKDENKIPNPIEDPGGYVPDMVKAKENMENNINKSVEKENQKLNNMLNESGVQGEETQSSETNYAQKYTAAMIKTGLGNIKVKFYASDAPVTVENFLKLAKSGFYDGTKFHRVIKGFMIQGGDPNSKTSDTSTWGMGGPGYKFKDELKGTEKYTQGTLAMANSGPNTNGSQFFIVTANPSYPLPPNYTIFGTVNEGMDTALKIENVKTTTNDRPLENVVIQSIEILEK